MTQATPRSRRSPAGTRARSRRPRRRAENSEVLVSAVISSYLLFFSWAGGGGYARRERAEPQALLTPEAPELKDRLSP